MTVSENKTLVSSSRSFHTETRPAIMWGFSESVWDKNAKIFSKISKSPSLLKTNQIYCSDCHQISCLG